jgi:t-SNARE complex subunit (syntaxin)
MKVYGREIFNMYGLTTMHRLEEERMAAYGGRMDERIRRIKELRAARKKVVTCVIIVVFVTIIAFMVG